MSKRSGVGKVVGRAATGMLNLGVLGGAVVGAVVLASWPIAALGGVAYAALVASDITNANFRRKVLFGKGAPAQLPKPASLSDPKTRAAVESITAARAEIDAVVKNTPDRIQRTITTTLTSLTELEGHGSMLALRADELSKYLATVTLADIEREAEELVERARDATDPGARNDYKEAADAAKERVKTTRDISAARERTLAHLARIAATMKGVPAKLVRLRALDDQASDALTGDVGAELDRMNIDLRAFEQTLESIVEVQS
ncbi:MAG: hypothetical protein ABI867_22020 [Kofleriaceae bacterium]